MNFILSFFEKMFHIDWVLVNMMLRMLNDNHFLRISSGKIYLRKRLNLHSFLLWFVLLSLSFYYMTIVGFFFFSEVLMMFQILIRNLHRKNRYWHQQKILVQFVKKIKTIFQALIILMNGKLASWWCWTQSIVIPFFFFSVYIIFF